MEFIKFFFKSNLLFFFCMKDVCLASVIVRECEEIILQSCKYACHITRTCYCRLVEYSPDKLVNLPVRWNCRVQQDCCKRLQLKTEGWAAESTQSGTSTPIFRLQHFQRGVRTIHPSRKTDEQHTTGVSSAAGRGDRKLCGCPEGDGKGTCGSRTWWYRENYYFCTCQESEWDWGESWFLKIWTGFLIILFYLTSPEVIQI